MLMKCLSIPDLLVSLGSLWELRLTNTGCGPARMDWFRNLPFQKETRELTQFAALHCGYSQLPRLTQHLRYSATWCGSSSSLVASALEAAIFEQLQQGRRLNLSRLPCEEEAADPWWFSSLASDRHHHHHHLLHLLHWRKKNLPTSNQTSPSPQNLLEWGKTGRSMCDRQSTRSEFNIWWHL